MLGEALGIIETYGYLESIISLDIALKTSNIKYVDLCFVKSGIVSCFIKGDVSAVEEALYSVKNYLNQINKAVNTHIIPKPYLDTYAMIKENKLVREKSNYVNKVEKEQDSKDNILKEVIGKSLKELEKMKTVDLRKMARQLDNFIVERSKIKYLRKDELIEGFIKYCERRRNDG